MKAFIFLAVALFAFGFFGGCAASKLESHQQQQYRLVYLQQFKLTYLKRLMSAGFNGSDCLKDLFRFDHSGFTEPILRDEDLRFIDSLVYADNEKMKADSAARIGRVAEGAEGKHVFSFIVEKFDSKWIDSIAKERYRCCGIKYSWK